MVSVTIFKCYAVIYAMHIIHYRRTDVKGSDLPLVYEYQNTKCKMLNSGCLNGTVGNGIVVMFLFFYSLCVGPLILTLKMEPPQGLQQNKQI